MTHLADQTQWEKRAWLGGAAVLIAAMAMHLAVNWNITVYSDDYWYGTFFQGGLVQFLRNTLNHYRTVNGRVFVHILIPIVLLADTKLFAVLSPILTAAIFLLGLRVQDKKLGGGVLLLASGLGLLSVLGSEIQYLRMSLYWIAAYFNYAFPLIFPLAVLWGMDRALENKVSKPGAVGLCLCALLSGASTEQCGVTALILVCGYWALLMLRKRPLPRLVHLCPLLTMAGYLTILTAPGSHARVARGIDGGIFSVFNPSVFTARFFDVMSYLCGYAFWNILFACLCILAGLVSMSDETLPRHLFSGFPAGIIAGVLGSLPGAQGLLAVFTVCYTVYLSVTFLSVLDYQITGLLLLGAGASVMMLIVTTLYYARCFFPCVLLFLMAAWSLLFRVLTRVKLPKGISAGVLVLLAAVFAARYIPIYQGYAANHVVVAQNQKAIERYQPGEELELSIDLDADYRFTSFFEGNYFLINFLQYNGLPIDTPVRFTSQVWDVSDVYVDGQRSVFPALEKDGQLLIPIDFVFQASGGTSEYLWTDYSFSLTHDGKSYTLYKDGTLVEHLPDGGRTVDESCEPIMPFSYTYTLQYLSADDFERCFGICFDYDAGTDSYVFRNS